MTPDAAMLAPVHALARFMASGDARHLDGVFCADLAIVENFPPFLFQGPGAAERWRDGFRAHALRNGLAELEASFGPAQDFRQEGELAYFALPTRWTGASSGARFDETGGWAFVLAREAGAWRIRAYGWAVTSTAGAG
jgi:hypothetical protein